MRSTLLYYRKHHGQKAWLARWLEEGLYTLRFLRNRFSPNSGPPRARPGSHAAAESAAPCMERNTGRPRKPAHPVVDTGEFIS